MLNFFRILLPVFFLSCGPALACLEIKVEDHHYPSCTIPEPAAGETVTVVTDSGISAVASHHLGESTSRTRLVVVNVERNDNRNYIVLDAVAQIIWQFHSDTDRVSTVIVLGAGAVGPDAAGVIGIPKEKIHFTDPDLTLLDLYLTSSCTLVRRACTASQWFGQPLNDQVQFHPEPQQPRLHADAFVGSWPATLSESNGPISIVLPSVADEIVTVDPEQIVALVPAEPYALLPGRPGMQQLIESGAVVPQGAALHTGVVGGYSEAFSRRFRSRFDPDFLFVPHVDYLVTRAVTLPPQLSKMALMMASGISAPDMNGNSPYNVCLFFEQEAEVAIASRTLDSMRCSHNPWARGDHDPDVLSAAAAFDAMGSGSGCSLRALPEDTYVAVLALSEGERRRYRGDPFRRIDVEVTREGPVALYLSIEGGPVSWQVTGQNIAAVYLDQPPNFGMHEVVLNGEPYTFTALRNDKEGCPAYAPQFPNRLGPEIAHLDRIMLALTGHAIDRLITYEDEGPGAYAPGALVLRFVVD
jgi:hypothetical protein